MSSNVRYSPNTSNTQRLTYPFADDQNQGAGPRLRWAAWFRQSVLSPSLRWRLLGTAVCFSVMLSGCADLLSTPDEQPQDALVSIVSDAGVPPNQLYDATTPDDPLNCEELTLIPPALRGDIKYPLANPGDVVRLGLGHDTRRSELLQECTLGLTDSSDGQDTEFELREIESRQQLSADLRVDVGISAGFLGFGFSNRFRMARSRDFSEYDLNIWVRVRVQTGSEALVSGVGLSRYYSDLLRENPFEFQSRCGDRFVQEVTYGGELLVILSIATTSESDRKELSNRLSASFGLWGSADGSIEREIASQFEGREVTIIIDRTGGGGELPDISTAEELFRYAREFPAEVAQHEPVVFQYVTRPYGRIADGSICLPGFDQKSIRLIESAWDHLNQAVGIRNALEDAIENPSAYACGNNEQRRTEIEYMNIFLDRLDGVAEACALEMSVAQRTQTTGTSCRELEQLLLQYNPPEIPLRWQITMPFTASAKERFHSFNIPDSVFCEDPSIEGLWSPWSRNNNCPNPDACWKPCPEGARVGTEYQLEFTDSRVSDNRGVCTYTFRCLDAEDAYLLDQCASDE